MTHVSIIGTGTMGQAIAGLAARGGHTVQLLGQSDTGTEIAGDIVVLAVPFPAVAQVIAERGDSLAGRIVVDITNPLNFETFDSLVVPANSSAAAEIAAALPESRVVKAFNTTFAGTLASGEVGPQTTTVLIAGDDADAKTDPGRFRDRRRPEEHRRRRPGARPRARGTRLPADQPGRAGEGLLDRRLRRRRLTHPSPPPTGAPR